MNRLEELIDLCKSSVSVIVNNHKDDYATVEEYVNNLLVMDEDLLEDIGIDVYDKMVKLDTIVEIIAYPDTPISSYRVIHYDLNMALDIMLGVVRGR